MSGPDELSQVADCLERVLDTGSETDWAELSVILKRSAEARRHYVRLLQLRALLLQSGLTAISRQGGDLIGLEAENSAENNLFETMILPGISGISQEEMEVQEEVFPPFVGRPAPSQSPRFASSIPKIAALLVIGFGVVIAASLMLLHPRPPVAIRIEPPPARVTEPSATNPVAAPVEQPVAQITRSLGARWEVVSHSDPSAGIFAHASLSLLEGYAELTSASGAKVILEAPAEFQVASAGEIELDSGRLSGMVPERARGFTVKTRQGTLVDLGTEFGVLCALDGPVKFDVFKGSVRVSPPTPQGVQDPLPGKLLSAGQAVMVSDGRVKIDPNGADAQRYVRSFSAARDHLDVVDLLCGGDGTTQNVGISIDANTGQAGKLDPAGEVAGDGKYHPVAGISVVDGVFVPNGSKGPMQVDSKGDRFAFPVTIGNSYNRICTGGAINWPTGVEAVSATVDGVDYSVSPHRIIALHSNQGISFNLAAIRRLHPGDTLNRFTCMISNSYTAKPSVFDVFVLVDGAVRFQRLGVTHSNGKVLVDVPLTVADHFITLVTSDGDKSVWGDWAIWCDPAFAISGKR